MVKLTQQQKLKIANEAADTMFEQISGMDESSKDDIREAISLARSDFIEAGFENWDIDNEEDTRSVALLMSKILKKWFKV